MDCGHAFQLFYNVPRLQFINQQYNALVHICHVTYSIQRTQTDLTN